MTADWHGDARPIPEPELITLELVCSACGYFTQTDGDRFLEALRLAHRCRTPGGLPALQLAPRLPRPDLPLHRTWVTLHPDFVCGTCDNGGCYDCTDPT